MLPEMISMVFLFAESYSDREPRTARAIFIAPHFRAERLGRLIM